MKISFWIVTTHPLGLLYETSTVQLTRGVTSSDRGNPRRQEGRVGRSIFIVSVTIIRNFCSTLSLSLARSLVLVAGKKVSPVSLRSAGDRKRAAGWSRWSWSVLIRRLVMARDECRSAVLIGIYDHRRQAALFPGCPTTACHSLIKPRRDASPSPFSRPLYVCACKNPPRRRSLLALLGCLLQSIPRPCPDFPFRQSLTRPSTIPSLS